MKHTTRHGYAVILVSLLACASCSRQPAVVPKELSGKVHVQTVSLMTADEAAAKHKFAYDPEGKLKPFDKIVAEALLAKVPGSRLVHLTCQVAMSVFESKNKQGEITAVFPNGVKTPPAALSTALKVEGEQLVQGDTVSLAILFLVPPDQKSFSVAYSDLTLFQISLK